MANIKRVRWVEAMTGLYICFTLENVGSEADFRSRRGVCSSASIVWFLSSVRPVGMVVM